MKFIDKYIDKYTEAIGEIAVIIAFAVASIWIVAVLHLFLTEKESGPIVIRIECGNTRQ